MSYQIKTESFQGPFHLLLQLIEKQELDITEISLARVADDFLNYLKELKEISSKELADFLEIAAKLILIKSRALLPQINNEEEKDDEEDLVKQLKIYQQYVLASREVENLVKNSKRSFSRDKIPLEIIPNFSQEVKVSSHTLEKYFNNFFENLIRQIKFKQKTFKRKFISLKEKIGELLKSLKEKKEVIFNSLIKGKQKPDQVGLFLATLELAKRKEIYIQQAGLFEDIIISRIHKSS